MVSFSGGGKGGSPCICAGFQLLHVCTDRPLSRLLAQGLSTSQILTRYENGSRALNAADWSALGKLTTTPLAKAGMIEQGVNAASQSYSLTTTTLQSIGKSFQLAPTGLTPFGSFGSGVIGSATGASQLFK